MPPQLTTEDVAALKATPVGMLKYSLRYRGLSGGMNDPRDDLLDRIASYVSDGRLPVAGMRDLVLTAREAGPKTVELFKLSKHGRQAITDATLPRRARSSVVPGSAGALAAGTSYSHRNDSLLRACWIEEHTRYEINREELRLDPVAVTKWIMIEADPRTGHAFLAYDRPEAINPHGTAVQFHEYARGLINTLSDGGAERLSLGVANTTLIGGDEIVLVKSRIETDDDLSWTVATQSRDPRDGSSYNDMHPHVTAWPMVHCRWKETKAGELLRRLSTKINAEPGLVEFMKDTCGEELRYVIARLREIA